MLAYEFVLARDFVLAKEFLLAKEAVHVLVEVVHVCVRFAC